MQPRPPCFVDFIGSQPDAEPKKQCSIRRSIGLAKIEREPPHAATAMDFLIGGRYRLPLRRWRVRIAVAEGGRVVPYALKNILPQRSNWLNLLGAPYARKRVLDRESLPLKNVPSFHRKTSSRISDQLGDC